MLCTSQFTVLYKLELNNLLSLGIKIQFYFESLSRDCTDTQWRRGITAANP